MARIIKVLIADDHPIFRHGLAAMIEVDSEMRVVGEAENGTKALELIAETDPDIVILDIDMPVMNGIKTAEALRDAESRADVIFLSMLKDRSVLRSLKSLQVKGYVVKDSAINEIVSCIRLVRRGGIYLSPVLNDLVLDQLEDHSESELLLLINCLTTSEAKILKLISQSRTNREIAEELFVSIRTVESHRYRICQKLNLTGAHALLLFATKNKDKIRSLTQNK